MDARKDYVAPAIAAEDMLEQTSLACAATQPWSDKQPGGVFTSVICETNVTKNGSFVEGENCSWIMEGPADVVALS